MSKYRVGFFAIVLTGFLGILGNLVFSLDYRAIDIHTKTWSKTILRKGDETNFPAQVQLFDSG
jgi:hypothetical protein